MEEFSTSLNHLPLLSLSHWSNHNFCLPQVPKAPSLDQVQGQPCEAAAGGDDWAGGGQAPGHSSVWGPAGVVGSAQCAQEDQTGGDDGQHPDTR